MQPMLMLMHQFSLLLVTDLDTHTGDGGAEET